MSLYMNLIVSTFVFLVHSIEVAACAFLFLGVIRAISDALEQRWANQYRRDDI